MRKLIQYRAAVKLLGIGTLLAVLAACASTPKTTEGVEPKEKEESAPLYYDFGDVLIPRELQLDSKNSFVYRTPSFSAGVLIFNSRVERDSLIGFFENNMAKDNWKAVSAFKSPRTLLLFQKENRWCVINITDRSYDTLVEIWVAPYSDLSESGLLK